MSTRVVDFLIAGTATAVGAYLKEIVFKGDTTLAYTLSVAAAVGVFVSAHAAASAIRRLLKTDKRFRLIGEFVETCEKNGRAHISFLRVKHNPVTDQFAMSGETYDVQTGGLYASWSSNTIIFDGARRVIMCHSADIRMIPNVITGYMCMNFVGPDGDFDEGTGFVVEDGGNQRLDFLFERLPPKAILEATGKTKLKTRQDRITFFNWWLNRQ